HAQNSTAPHQRTNVRGGRVQSRASSTSASSRRRLGNPPINRENPFVNMQAGEHFSCKRHCAAPFTFLWPRWGGVETLGMMLLGKRGQHGKLPLYNYASRWLWDNYDTYLLISRLLPRNEVGALSVGSSVLGTDQHTVPQNVNG